MDESFHSTAVAVLMDCSQIKSLSDTHTLGGDQVVADTLQVRGDEEVEEWVLRAIQTGLMEAKMDQIQRVVVIQRCTNRVFGPSQWKVISF